MPTYNITLNSSNLVGVNNNTFQYNFKTGSVDIPADATMSLSQVTIPYSWRNITQSLGNNKWSYTVPIGDLTTQNTYGPYTIPDGFYTTSDLQNEIQTKFRENGHCWYRVVATEGTHNKIYEYPIYLSENLSLYTNTISCVVIPIAANVATVFGTGALISNGSNGTVDWTDDGAYPTVGGSVFQLVFSGISTPTSTLLSNVLGFKSPASYPAVWTGYSTSTGNRYVKANGNTLTSSPAYAPLSTQVNGVIIRCNLVENPIASPSDVLDSFAITSTYGSNINYMPIGNNAVKMKKGKFNNVTISFSDQNYNPILALDPNVLITIIITLP